MKSGFVSAQGEMEIEKRAMTEDNPGLLPRILRAPVLHFFVLGAILFGTYTLFADKQEEEGKQIVISAQQVELLASLWEKQWRRPPMPEELNGLVQSYIREEVLYREALALGLDRDDQVVRRRLAQKIEFLAQDLATAGEPGEAELRAFYEEHPEIFEEPARITFSHVYINTDKHGAESVAVAERFLAELESGADPSQVGDRFMLQSEYLRKSPDEVARHFGRQFAEEVFAIEPRAWAGPVQSGYGLHLVFVEGVQDAFQPPLEEIRQAVRDEFMSYRRREVDELFYNKLREGYEIVIEEPQTSEEAAAES
jgi:peptidyl-prolyl cis-trans isomerase C